LCLPMKKTTTTTTTIDEMNTRENVPRHFNYKKGHRITERSQIETGNRKQSHTRNGDGDEIQHTGHSISLHLLKYIEELLKLYARDAENGNTLG
jgi:hypothetical protein